MPGQNRTLEENPHLAPALTAVILGVAVLAAFGFYARSLEYRSITALAADEAIIERDGKLAPVKNQGTALQQAALDTGCLLPVYGSSELNLQAAYNRPFHATNLLHLSLQLRQDAARRMLQFPATVANRPLLRFALENLADGSPLSLAC
jgi:poly-D-alanine transfer protein DltD